MWHVCVVNNDVDYFLASHHHDIISATEGKRSKLPVNEGHRKIQTSEFNQTLLILIFINTHNKQDRTF